MEEGSLAQLKTITLIAYMLGHWETLTRFLHEPGAPLENNLAERALKLAIRQRKNSLLDIIRNKVFCVDFPGFLASNCYFE